MQIRQFEGANIQEAMVKVRNVLGPQAVILATKEEKDSSKPHVIVTAAVDQDISSSVEPDFSSQKINKQIEMIEGILGDSGLLGVGDAQLESTLFLLRDMIDRAIRGRIPDIKKPAQKWIELLMDRGVEHSTAYVLVYKLLTVAGKAKRKDGISTDLLKEVMARIFRVTGEIKHEKRALRFIVFLGSPGVGKTTTLAKLAARIKQKTTRPIVLLSTDVYRIGAMDQLYIYGDLMGVPVEAARSKRDFRNIFDSYTPDTLFLVDTTGRSHMDDQGLMEIKILIDNIAKEMWAYLLLDAGRKRVDLLDEIRGYSLFPIQSLIWTKVDETGMPGEMINIMLRTKLPVSYITTGQNVPGDIEVADSRRLVEIILANKKSRRFLWTKRQN